MSAKPLISRHFLSTLKAFEQKKQPFGLFQICRGARYWIRTSDPRRVKAMLYH